MRNPFVDAGPSDAPLDANLDTGVDAGRDADVEAARCVVPGDPTAPYGSWSSWDSARPGTFCAYDQTEIRAVRLVEDMGESNLSSDSPGLT